MADMQPKATVAHSTPLLSVVIPTRNRPRYLLSTVRSILRWESDEFELIVHDNSNTPDLHDIVAKEFSDFRLRYFYTPTPLNFCETFERAVSFAMGEYVCIIGDDDGITPEAMHIVRWAYNQDLDAVISTLKAVYGWPDFCTRYYKDSDAGKLRIQPFTGAISYPDATVELQRSASHAFQNFCNLPKIYYGFVRQRCLAALRRKAGALFFGTTPDLSAAVALTSCVGRYCVVDYPVFLPGSSAGSGAGRSAMKKHVGALESAWQTCRFASSWPELVPRFYAVQTVWAQAALEALHVTGRDEVVSHFNIPLLHALCMAYNPAYWREVIRSLPKALMAAGEGRGMGLLRFAAGLAATMGVRFKSHSCRFLGTGAFRYERVFSNVPDIDVAVSQLLAHLQATGRSFASETATIEQQPR